MVRIYQELKFCFIIRYQHESRLILLPTKEGFYFCFYFSCDFILIKFVRFTNLLILFIMRLHENHKEDGASNSNQKSNQRMVALIKLFYFSIRLFIIEVLIHLFIG